MSKSEQTKYLTELSRRYPTRRAAMAEIIKLGAILNLPKGTEHFLSDLHGEHEAFSHIRRNASGVIRKKIDALFSERLSESERAELSTLIYYPEEKLDSASPDDEEFVSLIGLLVELLRLVSEKYTRAKVRGRVSTAAAEYDSIIEELIYDSSEGGQARYYENIPKTVARLGAGREFVIALCRAVKALAIDHLHVVGDIFDRGPRADLIVDELMREDSIDLQWGNHDVLWMGAGAGSRTCIATVINNSITYKNLDVLEIGYGISLRPLSLFAAKTYADCDVSVYMPRGDSSGNLLGGDDEGLIARMHKAISVIQFKLEGQTIKRNPDFLMDDRLLLDGLRLEDKRVVIGGKRYPLRDSCFPTVDPDDPYRLTDEEAEVMRHLKASFMRSERLGRHIAFLYEKGAAYTVFNRNLLFHGCIPLDSDGELLHLPAAGGRCGRELMDYCDAMARRGFFAPEGSAQRQRGKDFLWFLWCGRNSPLCARERITTFERLLIEDKSTWVEPKNAYYRAWEDESVADKILREFGLGGEGSHIINGHIPVERGEAPVKAGGKLIVIDGGFCRAYHEKTGIAGYTLIYNAEGIRLSAHAAFPGKAEAIKNNADIISGTVVFERAYDKIRVRETDVGERIREKITDLMLLVKEFECGSIKEKQ